MRTDMYKNAGKNIQKNRALSRIAKPEHPLPRAPLEEKVIELEKQLRAYVKANELLRRKLQLAGRALSRPHVPEHEGGEQSRANEDLRRKVAELVRTVAQLNTKLERLEGENQQLRGRLRASEGQKENVRGDAQAGLGVERAIEPGREENEMLRGQNPAPPLAGFKVVPLRKRG